MRQLRKWYRLDNAATIVPSSAHGADTRVFRIACELKENADPEILQEALDRTVKKFPYLLSVLRKGFFWYYLDSREIRPVVEEESFPACSPLYFEGRKNLLFRVVYYRRRISLEMFHVLSDGSGAFIFFKALLTKYLSLKYHLELSETQEEKASDAARTADAFKDYYDREKKGLKQLKAMALHRAYRIRGDLDENLLPHLVEGTVPAGRFLQEAKKRGVTVGVLTTGIYIAAVIDEMSAEDKKRPIVVSVPVDLRKYYPTETIRNFFGVINISYNAGHYDGNPESILDEVKESFREQLSPEKISQVMNSYEELEHNLAIKMFPLAIKDIGTNRLNLLASMGVTSTMSNLGVVRMPEAEPYITKFSAFMTAPSEQICIVTYGDSMVFGEVSACTTHEVMLHFFRRIAAMGIPVEVATNDYEEA